MTYQVLLQTIPDDGYCAMTLGLPDCVGRGQTRDEAVANLKAALSDRLSKGEIITVEVGEPEHPWLKWAGMWSDDPTFDEFLGEMASYRRQVDEAEQSRDEVSSGH